MLIMGLDEGWTLRARIWTSLSLWHVPSLVNPAGQNLNGNPLIGGPPYPRQTNQGLVRCLVTILIDS